MVLKCMLMAAALLLGTAMGEAQDTGRSLLTAARKRTADARGKKGQERTKILEDSLRILRMVPERFPGEKPAVARAHLEMGRLLRRLGRRDQAVPELKLVLAVEGQERTACQALHELASLYRKAKQKKEAAAALQEIVAHYPKQGFSRARALIRLAGLKRASKDYAAAEELLRQCLKEHADLWRPSVDALDALLALKLRQKQQSEALQVFQVQSAAIRTRFSGTTHEARVASALAKMKSLKRLQKKSSGGGS